ncbi:MAG TPA: DUF2249 domain-containing protein [Pelobium sp.]|nr:DUF2249 domain-containing protein [Pelobium sp.]
MEKIDINSKIGKIIRANPDALEAIVSIDPKLEKLRNPILRKILANRTSIAMASKMVGHSVDEFFAKLKPLGFEVDEEVTPVETEPKDVPEFVADITKDQIIDFDVRALLTSGQDPLSLILEKIKTIQAGQALKIINTFEPIPLVKMLEKKGFIIHIDHVAEDLVETYFYKPTEAKEGAEEVETNEGTGWEALITQFNNNLIKIDVRELEMPKPMHTILGELENLPKEKALFVYHKRIPVFLLPELAEQGFEYRIQEINDGEVHLLIYKD